MDQLLRQAVVIHTVHGGKVLIISITVEEVWNYWRLLVVIEGI